MRIIGLDVGGANLKISDGEAESHSLPFAMWREFERLPAAITALLAQAGGAPIGGLAVTMTGELADCFTTKAEGVRGILQAVAAAAPDCRLVVWQTSGEFVAAEIAMEEPRLTAAANWHALATWIAPLAGNTPGLLIDIGSTTADLIPLCNGLPDPLGRTDLERLLSGELVYTGVRRTPLNCLTSAVTLRELRCPLAAELFATTLDLYLLQGDIPESADTGTADGRPATREAARQRIARQFCCDRTELTNAEIDSVGAELVESQQQILSAALDRVAGRLGGPPATVIVGGEGEFLAHRLLGRSSHFTNSKKFSLSNLLGPQHSIAACAYALARLAKDRRA